MILDDIDRNKLRVQLRPCVKGWEAWVGVTEAWAMVSPSRMRWRAPFARGKLTWIWICARPMSEAAAHALCKHSGAGSNDQEAYDDRRARPPHTC